jgi:hypothetical protein
MSLKLALRNYSSQTEADIMKSLTPANSTEALVTDTVGANPPFTFMRASLVRSSRKVSKSEKNSVPAMCRLAIFMFDMKKILAYFLGIVMQIIFRAKSFAQYQPSSFMPKREEFWRIKKDKITQFMSGNQNYNLAGDLC